MNESERQKQIEANMEILFKHLRDIDPAYLSAVRGTLCLGQLEETPSQQDKKTFGGLKVFHSLDRKHLEFKQSRQTPFATQPEEDAETDPEAEKAKKQQEQRKYAKDAVQLALQEARSSEIPWHTIITLISRV